MKAVIFDLDDTLYAEIDYVRSGFEAVADYLKSFGKDKAYILRRLIEIFNSKGRGLVFNDILVELDIYSDQMVKTLLYIYRNHNPKIVLPAESVNILNKLLNKGIKLGIITDGASITQNKKIEALGIEKYCSAIVITDVLGVEFWKPSIFPFQVALNLLSVQPSEALYVGDNPVKDFAGANKLNIKSVWLKKGYDDFQISEDIFKPTVTIRSLDKLLDMV
jgi:putative hydrolase of the HAD superfamily